MQAYWSVTRTLPARFLRRGTRGCVIGPEGDRPSWTTVDAPGSVFANRNRWRAALAKPRYRPKPNVGRDSGRFLARRVILQRRMTSVANGALRKSLSSHLSQRATLATPARRRPRAKAGPPPGGKRSSARSQALVKASMMIKLLFGPARVATITRRATRNPNLTEPVQPNHQPV